MRFLHAPDSASEEVDACCSAARFVGVRTTGLCVVPFSCGCGSSEGSSGSIVSSSGVFTPPPVIVEEAQCVDRSDRGACPATASHPCIPITRTPPEPPCIKSRPLDLKTPSRWAMETPGISESTPLLFSSSVPRPCIRPVINRLLAQSNTTPTADHILAQIPLAHRDLISSYRTAFVLVTLLQIESDTRKQLARDDSLNLWDAWDHHVNAELVVEHCASHVLEVWTGFLRIPRNNANLDALIWTAFPLEEDGSTSVCRMCLTFTSYLDSRKN